MLLVSTCGTSLLTNMLSAAERGKITRLANKKEDDLSGDGKRALDRLAAARKTELPEAREFFKIAQNKIHSGQIKNTTALLKILSIAFCQAIRHWRIRNISPPLCEQKSISGILAALDENFFSTIRSME